MGRLKGLRLLMKLLKTNLGFVHMAAKKVHRILPNQMPGLCCVRMR